MFHGVFGRHSNITLFVMTLMPLRYPVERSKSHPVNHLWLKFQRNRRDKWLSMMSYFLIYIHLCWVAKWIVNTYRRYKCSLLSSFMTYNRGCNYINTTGATSGKRSAYPSGAPEFIPSFSGVHVTRSLVLCVCFVDRCLSFVFWPLYCLFFFDIWIRITPLVSSNSS